MGGSCKLDVFEGAPVNHTCKSYQMTVDSIITSLIRMPIGFVAAASTRSTLRDRNIEVRILARQDVGILLFP